MYFSEIRPQEGRVKEALRANLSQGLYQDHQWLWQWFPSPPGSPRDYLFRRHDVSGSPRFYTVSRRAPLPQLSGWCAQSKPYTPTVAAGEVLQFDLRANATVRHGRDGKSKRHDVVMEAKKTLLQSKGLVRWGDWASKDRPDPNVIATQACADWLARRGERLGFRLVTDTIAVDGYQQHKERPDRSLTLSTVEMSGQLVVTDSVAFRAALLEGIGSAKGLGCGLLLVRRPG